ncbi:hypothetical protein ACO22_03191 [Paracoccidioides brasiliensis]|uniref:Uncharacterized protein n=1 Tax=Paracoccidioides brasiliensis TaxID=121759 RepID=A0A1D2JGL0_PARBR|nr:hypothetical protein ACO22_03191 [Paracoccidioides brasiliensis]
MLQTEAPVPTKQKLALARHTSVLESNGPSSVPLWTSCRLQPHRAPATKNGQFPFVPTGLVSEFGPTTSEPDETSQGTGTLVKVRRLLVSFRWCSSQSLSVWREAHPASPVTPKSLNDGSFGEGSLVGGM